MTERRLRDAFAVPIVLVAVTLLPILFRWLRPAFSRWVTPEFAEIAERVLTVAIIVGVVFLIVRLIKLIVGAMTGTVRAVRGTPRHVASNTLMIAGVGIGSYALLSLVFPHGATLAPSLLVALAAVGFVGLLTGWRLR